MTDPGRQLQAIRLIEQSLELAGTERQEFLDDACSNDLELRQEIESLLAEEADDDFLEQPAAQIGRTIVTTSALETDLPLEPEQLGTYRIVKLLGRGGMGAVYLGEQEAPVRRQVALKIIDAPQHLHGAQRFAQECQALAHLNHPNVASLYEVGSTEDGQPFLAMELVDGTAITDWCDSRRLTLAQRIELFYGVCAGVRHAHQKGILHRDIKPSNVLVTEIDDQPMAKVIDFGVARALDERLLGNKKQVTLDHQIVGSPAYMSPETARGESDIDTRADVYALGMLLYELLVGVLPFDLEKESLASLLRRLTTEELTAPSVRFVALAGEKRSEIARQRRLNKRTLERAVRGDLDAIIATATARDRDQRYSSPSELEEDLSRHLSYQPISVRAASLHYRLGRYVRRNLGAVLAAAALILALLAGIVSSTRQAQRANREAQQAREVSQFLVDLFEIADPERGPNQPVDVRNLLDRGAERLREELQEQPIARARFLQTLGEIYTKMALFERGETLIREALELRQRELPATHPDLIDSTNQLGVILRRQGRFDEAEPLLRAALAARENVDPPDPLKTAQALNNLGNLLWNQGRREEALEIYERALSIRERELGRDDPDVGETVNNLAVLLRDLSLPHKALPYAQRAEVIFLRALGEAHPLRAAALNNLGLTERSLYRFQDAESHFRQAVTIWKDAYGPLHPRTVKARYNLARLLIEVGREPEAVEFLRENLQTPDELTGSALKVLPGMRRSLGLALGHLGDFEAAKAAFQANFEHYRATRGEDNYSTLRARANLAWLDWRQGRYAESETTHREILELRQRSPDSTLAIATSLRGLALTLTSQYRDAEAEPLLRRALSLRETGYGADHRLTGEVLLELGELAQRAGRLDEAKKLLLRAQAIYRQVLPSDHRDLKRVIAALEGT
ncbi:MAG: serine/threonine-protein kinase [Acidobacteriota bacterium]